MDNRMAQLVSDEKGARAVASGIDAANGATLMIEERSRALEGRIAHLKECQFEGEARGGSPNEGKRFRGIRTGRRELVVQGGGPKAR